MLRKLRLLVTKSKVWYNTNLHGHVFYTVMNLLCSIDETNVIVILKDMINKYNNFNTSESKSDHKRDFSSGYQHHFK